MTSCSKAGTYHPGHRHRQRRKHLNSPTIHLLHTRISTHADYSKRWNDGFQLSIMINAFLVFNGQGQPRLTKFYTQLVRLIPDRVLSVASNSPIFLLGNEHPAASHL